jgi:NAD(P)-dependent dehydrogenase (short-subunit alcohol dehydrogenase family)
MKDLTGKIAVVTGASRGLGRQAAIRLAERGATVVLVARSAASLESTARGIVEKGGHAEVVSADLSDARSIDKVEAGASRVGAPSILINAAGVYGPLELIKDSDPGEWIQTLMVNMVSHYLTCRAFVGGMIDQGWGRIVNVTSANALHPPGPLHSAYGTSKAALNHFTRHLAAEVKGTGVTANVIHPGDVKTEMWADIRTKARRLGAPAEHFLQWADWVEKTGGDDPQKAADLILNLMEDEAASANGRFLWIKDGLQTPIPSWSVESESLPWQK